MADVPEKKHTKQFSRRSFLRGSAVTAAAAASLTLDQAFAYIGAANAANSVDDPGKKANIIAGIATVNALTHETPKKYKPYTSAGDAKAISTPKGQSDHETRQFYEMQRAQQFYYLLGRSREGISSTNTGEQRDIAKDLENILYGTNVDGVSSVMGDGASNIFKAIDMDSYQEEQSKRAWTGVGIGGLGLALGVATAAAPPLGAAVLGGSYLFASSAVGVAPQKIPMKDRPPLEALGAANAILANQLTREYLQNDEFREMIDSDPNLKAAIKDNLGVDLTQDLDQQIDNMKGDQKGLGGEIRDIASREPGSVKDSDKSVVSVQDKTAKISKANLQKIKDLQAAKEQREWEVKSAEIRRDIKAYTFIATTLLSEFSTPDAARVVGGLGSLALQGVGLFDPNPLSKVTAGLGMLMTAKSLLGGSKNQGPSFQDYMIEAIRGIQSQLASINKKLDYVLANQELILENLEDVREALKRIEEVVMDSHYLIELGMSEREQDRENEDRKDMEEVREEFAHNLEVIQEKLRRYDSDLAAKRDPFETRDANDILDEYKALVRHAASKTSGAVLSSSADGVQDEKAAIKLLNRELQLDESVTMKVGLLSPFFEMVARSHPAGSEERDAALALSRKLDDIGNPEEFVRASAAVMHVLNIVPDGMITKKTQAEDLSDLYEVGEAISSALSEAMDEANIEELLFPAVEELATKVADGIEPVVTRFNRDKGFYDKNELWAFPEHMVHAFTNSRDMDTDVITGESVGWGSSGISVFEQIPNTYYLSMHIRETRDTSKPEGTNAGNGYAPVHSLGREYNPRLKVDDATDERGDFIVRWRGERYDRFYNTGYNFGLWGHGSQSTDVFREEGIAIERPGANPSPRAFKRTNHSVTFKTGYTIPKGDERIDASMNKGKGIPIFAVTDNGRVQHHHGLCELSIILNDGSKRNIMFVERFGKEIVPGKDIKSCQDVNRVMGEQLAAHFFALRKELDANVHDHIVTESSDPAIDQYLLMTKGVLTMAAMKLYLQTGDPVLANGFLDQMSAIVPATREAIAEEVTQIMNGYRDSEQFVETRKKLSRYNPDYGEERDPVRKYGDFCPDLSGDDLVLTDNRKLEAQENANGVREFVSPDTKRVLYDDRKREGVDRRVRVDSIGSPLKLTYDEENPTVGGTQLRTQDPETQEWYGTTYRGFLQHHLKARLVERVQDLVQTVFREHGEEQAKKTDILEETTNLLAGLSDHIEKERSSARAR